MKRQIIFRRIAVFFGLVAANLLVALLTAVLLLKTPILIGIAGVILLFFASFYIPNYFYREQKLVSAGFRICVLLLTGYTSILFLSNTTDAEGGTFLFFVFLFFALIVGAKTIFDVVSYFSRDV